MTKRISIFLYGVLAYLAFLVAILYLIGFVGNFFVPKSIDSGAETSTIQAVVVNLLLIGLFAVQHTIMARPAFKSWWKQILPEPMERSTFVLFASGILLLLFWQWQPIKTTIWHIEQPVLRVLLISISMAGWGLLFFSSFLIDHFDLFGLRQVTLFLRGKEYTQPRFVERSVYRVIRHPLMTGVLFGIWAAPTMTLGHLVLAVGLTGYIIVGVMFEERDLVRMHGESYEEYRRRTRKFFPIPQTAIVSRETAKSN
jgi:methanethiol S-methyltransferase